jgi:hypothetical protein
MNVKSTGVHKNSDGSVGRESAAPPAGPFHGATRRMIQRPPNNRGGCAAGENDRREALRFPALRGAPMPRRAEDPRRRKITTMPTTPQSAMVLPRPQIREQVPKILSFPLENPGWRTYY